MGRGHGHQQRHEFVKLSAEPHTGPLELGNYRIGAFRQVMFATHKIKAVLMESVMNTAWQQTAWLDCSALRAVVLAGDELRAALAEFEHSSAFGAPVCVFLVAKEPVGEKTLLASGALARSVVDAAEGRGLHAIAITETFQSSGRMSAILRIESAMAVCCAVAIGYAAPLASETVQ